MNSLFNNSSFTQNPSQMSPKQIIAMVKQSGKTPEQFVKDMLASGQISQEQFNNARSIANKTFNTNL